MRQRFLNNRQDSYGSLIENEVNDGNRVEEIEIVPIDESLKQDPNLPNHQKIDIEAFFERLKVEKRAKNDGKLQEDNKSDTRMKKVQIDLDSILQDKLVMWQNVDQWEFKFPETVFTGEEAPVAFSQQKQEIGTYPLSKLSEEQLQSIKQKGEFIIKIDSEYDLGTKWKMNPWFVKGRENIWKTFLNTLSFCWDQILQISWRLTCNNSQNQDIWRQMFIPNLISGVRSVTSLLGKVVNLTLGTPKVRIHTDDEILQELYKEEIEKAVLKYSEFMDNSFFLFVRDLFEPRNNSLNAGENAILAQKQRTEISRFNAEFRVKSLKLEKEKLSQLEAGEKDQDLALLEILTEKQKLLFTMMEEQNLLENVQARSHLIQLIKATQITARHYEKLQATIAIRQIEIQQELIKNHPVKSLVSRWLSDKINENMKRIIKELTVTCYSTIIQELKNEDLKQQSVLFETFNNFQLNQKSILNRNRSRIEKKIAVPTRIFYTYQDVLGEGEITRTVDRNDVAYFSEVKMKTHETTTSFYGWRVVLQLLRWMVWTVNVFGELTANLVNGQYGLKALFYSKPFLRHYSIDHLTGQKVFFGNINPYLEEVRNICRGITQSRANFEALPDRGIFGKNFARVCNYIECYFYRAIIIGIVVTVGMPIVILVNCILSFILAITCWLWVPILLVIRFMYQLLIFDFDSPARQGQRQYNSYEANYWTFEYFPLIVVIIQSVIGALEIATSLFSAAVIHPLLSIIGMVIAFIRIIISTSTDMLMYAITRSIGRQPELDSDIAWKVKGQDQQGKDSMEIEDVKCLVRSWLERQELDQCVADIRKKLFEPQVLYNQVVGGFFRQYGVRDVSNIVLSRNIQRLSQLLQNQYQNRIYKLPVLPECNVKFTDKEISQLVPACQTIVQSFIIGHYIGSWIFEKRDIDNKDYKTLTERALVELFNNEEVLSAASEHDVRNEMKKVKHSKYDSIQRAISEEANMQAPPSVVPQKYRKFKKQQLCRFVTEEEIESNARSANQIGIMRPVNNQDPSYLCFSLPLSVFPKK